ncbi:Maf family protein [Xanthobacter tagetidis]|uniref:Nucleoside triphosphate pyrophosphatase n=1 Tax=Xanthobacter tagetidis TaxID=60216 RepID=A0A3L7A5W5_9HYPH|nr:Maf family protein [Xanthobacter tagetidis]MBB6308725.1 septum formation protein [Xanthobacter tagetidis]RLP75435.1 septum formation inhibitor Maf [Xanthobacter tagetidis]
MTLWRGEQPLILASKSATRLTLLVHAGLPVETVVADVDERALEAEAGDIEPAKVALLLARAKALGGARAAPGRIVVGADQTLALGPEIFHKPRTVEAARDQLKRLSGHTHALHSAVAVAFDGTVVFDAVVSAFLTMRALSDDTLDTYLSAAGQRVLTSVGAYQLEAVGVHLFTRVDGDHFTILGLPLLQLLAFFREQGLLP